MALLEDVVFKTTLAEAITKYWDTNERMASSVGVEWEAFKVVMRGHCIADRSGVSRQLHADIACQEEVLEGLERAQDNTAEGKRALREEEMLATVERLQGYDYRAYTARAHVERKCWHG